MKIERNSRIQYWTENGFKFGTVKWIYDTLVLYGGVEIEEIDVVAVLPPVEYRPCHFPKGTKALVSVFMDNEFTLTVKSVIQNGVDSYVLESEEIDTDIKSHTYGRSMVTNMDHVKQILERGVGDEPTFMIEPTPVCGWKIRDKHPTSYNLNADIIHNIGIKYLSQYEFLDYDKLSDMLAKNRLRVDYTNPKNVNKKRFNRIIKRLVRHSLKTKKDFLEEERMMYDDIREDDYHDDLYEFDYNQTTESHGYGSDDDYL